MTPAEPLEHLDGVVERVVFIDRNGYTVLLLDAGEPEPVRAAGAILAGVQPGESLRLTGTWTQHHTRGRQFTAADVAHTLPASVHAMRRYLASGLVKGIGVRLADAIVAEFGTDIMRILEHEPDRLLEVDLIGPAVFAEFEADLLRMRTREGMAVARARGKLKGRQPKLSTRQQAELIRMHATGDGDI